MKNILAHMFWAYGDLSNLERICCTSFHRQGYELNLWTYGKISNAPMGVALRDAREILPEESVFLNAVGSYAGFSDLFRYAVLNTLGGLYADTDVIALKPASALPEVPFLVTERVRGLEGKVKVNGNILFNPVPKIGNVVDLAYAYSLRFPKTDITWGEIGPDLLTMIASSYRKHGFSILGAEFANPIDYWDCPKALLEPDRKLPGASAFLHCYNEMWRRVGVDKNAPYAEGCIMASMAARYL